MPSIAHLIHVYGLLGVAGLIGLECVGLPFPGETVLIVASVIAGAKHDLNIASVILTAAGAAIIGRMIGYVIGREYGYWLLLRYGGYLWITQSRIKLGQYLFLRHGGKIIFSRNSYQFSLNRESLPEPMHALAAFILTSIIGAFLWATLFGLAAYSLGRQVERLTGWMVLAFAILVVLVCIVVAAALK
jgi:membrane protein DedA with SNARE-associated domain